MDQILLRNVDSAVLATLRGRAAARGISLESELRDVLTRAAGHPRAGLAAEFAAVLDMTPNKTRRLTDDLVRETATNGEHLRRGIEPTLGVHLAQRNQR